MWQCEAGALRCDVKPAAPPPPSTAAAPAAARVPGRSPALSTCFNRPTELRSWSISSSSSTVPDSMLICSWSLCAPPAPPNSGCRALSPGLQGAAGSSEDSRDYVSKPAGALPAATHLLA